MAENNHEAGDRQPPLEKPVDEEEMEDIEEEVIEEEVEEEEVEEVEEEVEEEEEGGGEGKEEGDKGENAENEGEEAKKEGDKAEGADKDRNVEGGSPGKIFVGGLSKETTSEMFIKYFEKYGKITDSVIMKDRKTGHPRGFGFITFADPSVVDKVIEENHVINGKQVEIKRTIPKGALSGTKDFKTKKIFVGGIPTSVKEDELKNFFAKFGEVKEHQIMRDHSTKRSRGFGFITFASEESVDSLLSKGNRVDFAGVQVEIKKAQPKSVNPPPSSKFLGKKAAYGGSYGDYYGGYGGGYGAGAYGAGRGYSARPGAYGGYGSGGYEGFDGSGVPPYRDPALAYSGRYGEGGYGRGYGAGGYGKGVEGYGGYYGSGASGYGGGGGYDPSLRAAYGSAGAYGGRGGRGGYGGGSAGYGGGSRYHPYGR